MVHIDIYLNLYLCLKVYFIVLFVIVFLGYYIDGWDEIALPIFLAVFWPLLLIPFLLITIYRLIEEYVGKFFVKTGINKLFKR